MCASVRIGMCVVGGGGGGWGGEGEWDVEGDTDSVCVFMLCAGTTCPVCVSDTTTGQTCDEANDLDLCGDSTPYCMTSFYREPDGYRLEKRFG